MLKNNKKCLKLYNIEDTSMKGIIILGFKKSPGAYIEAQYPPNISSDLNIEPPDLMNIYALHRMRQMKPNFQKIKIKKINLASFYTGFSFKHCVGRPDKAITIILAEDEEISNDFEGMLRKYALEVISKIEDVDFGEKFIKYYRLLKRGQLEPYWEEHIEGEGSEIATTSSKELTESEIADIIDDFAIDLDDFNFIEQFEELEGEETKQEIEELRGYLKEQEAIMYNLAEEIIKFTAENQKLEQEVEALKEKTSKLELDKDNLQNQLKVAQKPIKAAKQVAKKPAEKIKLKPKIVAKSKPATSGEEEIREKWLSIDIKQLKDELSKTNMNKIRQITKPWNLKPKGRTKKDLINAVVDYIQNIKG